MTITTTPEYLAILIARQSMCVDISLDMTTVQSLSRHDRRKSVVNASMSRSCRALKKVSRFCPTRPEGKELKIVSSLSPRSLSQVKTKKSDPDAIALVEKLDGLPLALSTAGVYLEQVTTSFLEYLQYYKESWLKLQMTSPQLSSYEDRSMYTTWQLSLDQVQRQNRLSAKLLKLWAYFDRQDVWFELLRHGGSTEHDWIRALTKDE